MAVWDGDPARPLANEDTWNPPAAAAVGNMRPANGDWRLPWHGNKDGDGNGVGKDVPALWAVSKQ